jgi:mannose-6-phosphate isomerase-like protein (cupin superfamily)
MTDRDGAETVWFLATRMAVLATAETTAGALGLVEQLVPAGFSPPLHVHSREDELFYVIDGRVTCLVGDRRFEAGPGSFVFLPRDIPHSFVVEGDAPARILELVLPGGLERFHVEAGRPVEGPGLPPPAPPDIAKLEQHAARYGVRTVGPPMSPRASNREEGPGLPNASPAAK